MLVGFLKKSIHSSILGTGQNLCWLHLFKFLSPMQNLKVPSFIEADTICEACSFLSDCTTFSASISATSAFQNS